MDKIQNIKISLSIIINTLLVTISYELKEHWKYSNQYFYLIAIIAGFILSNLLSVPLSKFLLKSQFARKLIFGKKDIEGLWKLTTESGKNSISDFAVVAIVKITYEHDQNSFKVVGHRTDKNGDEVNTNSIFATYNFNTGEYLNVTRISGKDRIITGLAYGHFFSDSTNNNNKTNKYNGILLLEGAEGPLIFTQKGERYNNGKNESNNS